MISFIDYMTDLGGGHAPRVIGQVPPDAIELRRTSAAVIQSIAEADAPEMGHYVDPSISHVAYYRGVSLGYVDASGPLPEYWVTHNDPADGPGITCWWFDRDPDTPDACEIGYVWSLGAEATAAASVEDAFAHRWRTRGAA
jgi:hypothetical protein